MKETGSPPTLWKKIQKLYDGPITLFNLLLKLIKKWDDNTLGEKGKMAKGPDSLTLKVGDSKKQFLIYLFSQFTILFTNEYGIYYLEYGLNILKLLLFYFGSIKLTAQVVVG